MFYTHPLSKAEGKADDSRLNQFWGNVRDLTTTRCCQISLRIISDASISNWFANSRTKLVKSASIVWYSKAGLLSPHCNEVFCLGLWSFPNRWYSRKNFKKIVLAVVIQSLTTRFSTISSLYRPSRRSWVKFQIT